jgi:hypothetical protein
LLAGREEILAAKWTTHFHGLARQGLGSFKHGLRKVGVNAAKVNPLIFG